MLSPYEVGREIGYTAQEDLKPLIVVTRGVEGTIGSLVFSVPAFQDSPGFYLHFCPWITTGRLWHHKVLCFRQWWYVSAM